MKIMDMRVTLASTLLMFASVQYANATSTVVTDAIGTQEVWTFEENLGVQNMISRVNQVDGKGVYQTWDANNNLLSRTDSEGRTTTYTYNATNQRISKTEASGTSEARTTSYEYVSADIDIVTKTISPSVYAGNSKEVVTTYDSALNATQTQINGFAPDGSPVSRSMDFTYDDLGKITQIDGYRTDIADLTTFTYYNCFTGAECGQLQSVSNALGHTTSYDSYDANARLLQSTDQTGVVTTHTYHPRGWLLTRTQTAPNGDQRVTSYAYDPDGLMIQSTSPDGTILNYEYDAAHDLRAISDNLNNRVEYTYDAKGNRNVEQTFDPSGTLIRDIQTAYDIRNFVESINAAGSVTQMVNDAVGNLTTQTDPNQNPSTDHSYDGLYRLTNTIDALTNSTGYEYNVADQLIKVTAPNGAITEYVYDDLGNLLSENSPDRGTTTYTHDDAGNVLSMTDARGITSNYSYDALNRLTNVAYPTAAENINYHYDIPANLPPSITNLCHETDDSFAVGRLCQVEDESGLMNYRYDVWGNVSSHLRQELGQFFLTQYQYDDANRLIQMTYPSGRVVDYQRDVIGRLIGTTTTDSEGTQTPLITNRNYRADGLWTEQVYGSGLTQTKNYDQQGRLTDHQVSNTGNTDEYSRQYIYDANGNILREQSLDNLYDTDYQYDALDRLTEELDSIKTLTRGFDYDANGNRLEESEDDNGSTQITPFTYTNQSNRIETINGQTISLDPSGRTLQDGEGRSYAYNDAGRIRSISMNGQVVGEYFYNSQQLRTRKVINGNTIFYHYDLAGNLIAESDTNTHIDVTNRALGQTASQSSIYAGGVPSRAVDGDTSGLWINGSVTLTKNDVNAWWQVDLGDQYALYDIRVHNRYGSAERLSNFYVMVSDQPFGNQTLSELLANPNVLHQFHVGTLANISANFEVNGVQSRYVRVQLQGQNHLHLAEVEVFGAQINTPSVQTTQEYIYAEGGRIASVGKERVSGSALNNTISNIALGKAAEQRSIYVGGVPSRAVDGNTSGVFSHQSVSHTKNHMQSWWQVDLGSQSSIEQIKVHNRTDADSDRLSDFYVFVSDEPFNGRSLDELLADSTIERQFHAGTPATALAEFDFTNATGRYVRIQLQGANHLSLAEVEVMGTAAEEDTIVDNAIQYYVNDHLNTPQQLLNENNTITWEAGYEAFGEASITTQQVTNNHRFPGQYYDKETGLHYNWNRYYDVTVGRYITSDPAGLYGGLNSYAYVGSNPLAYIDIMGLMKCKSTPLTPVVDYLDPVKIEKTIFRLTYPGLRNPTTSIGPNLPSPSGKLLFPLAPSITYEVWLIKYRKFRRIVTQEVITTTKTITICTYTDECGRDLTQESEKTQTDTDTIELENSIQEETSEKFQGYITL